MNFLERIIGMIIKPDEATRDILQKPYFEEALLLVGLYAILSLVSVYISLSKTTYTGEIEGIDMETMKTVILIFTIISSLILVLILWPLLTVIYHVLSMFFGGDGKIWPNLLTVIGYTTIPSILITLVTIVIAFLKPATTVDISSYSTEAAGNMFSDPLTIIGLIVAFISILWTFYLVMLAVKNGEKLGTMAAAIVSGIPALILLLITFGGILFSMIGF